MTLDLPKPWRLVNAHRSSYIGRELAWELSHFADHPLVGRTFTVIALLDEYDNAIIRFDDGSFGYVHLTWKAESPHFVAIGGHEELMRFLNGQRRFPLRE